MRKAVAFLGSTLVILVTAMSAPPLLGGVMPITGKWRLDEKNSRNVPDQAKTIDLDIKLNGKMLSTQREFEAAPIGEALVIAIDGVPVEREIAKGTRGTISAEWMAGGKLLRQVIKTRAANLLAVTQTTDTTVTEDGEVMTRVQTTKTGGDTAERVLIYRRKH